MVTTPWGQILPTALATPCPRLDGARAGVESPVCPLYGTASHAAGTRVELCLCSISRRDLSPPPAHTLSGQRAGGPGPAGFYFGNSTGVGGCCRPPSAGEPGHGLEALEDAASSSSFTARLCLGPSPGGLQGGRPWHKQVQLAPELETGTTQPRGPGPIWATLGVEGPAREGARVPRPSSPPQAPEPWARRRQESRVGRDRCPE